MNPLPELNNYHEVFTVSKLNHSTKLLLEQSMPLLWVKGEISNLKRYQSGHWYFSLKDANAQVRCVMFRHKNQYLDWQPKDGLQVEVRALVTLYESRGDFQLNVETIRRAGLGELFEAFEQLKIRLEKAGLFDPERKKPLPSFPQQIGIITSPNTAALRDVVSTLQRRMPMLPVIIYPTPVQGKDAAKNIVESIQLASKRADCDVLILCRGGGSIEDLWSFNEEIVAQAIAACKIPVITGIGHETDFTIADFVADKRAPTPTGAAELASQDSAELHRRLNTLQQRLQRVIVHHLEQCMQQTDGFAHRLIHPGERIHNQRMHLQHLQERLISNWTYQAEKKYWKLCELNQRLSSTVPKIPLLLERQDEFAQRLHQALFRYLETRTVSLQHKQTQLAHLNPQSVLERGYSITYSTQGAVIRDSKQINAGDKIQVKFAKGKADAEVTKINKK
jgi:exodeoxyribonuclease VII large subunit